MKFEQMANFYEPLIETLFNFFIVNFLFKTNGNGRIHIQQNKSDPDQQHWIFLTFLFCYSWSVNT